MAGTADGRILAFSGSDLLYNHVTGEGHNGLVSALAAGPDGSVFSTGFDDRVREVDNAGKSFRLVVICLRPCLSCIEHIAVLLCAQRLRNLGASP